MRAILTAFASLSILLSLPAAPRAGDGSIRMLILLEIYRQIVETCDFDIDPGYVGELEGAAALLGEYTSEKDWNGVSAAIAAEGITCDPESSWVRMLQDAERNFKAP